MSQATAEEHADSIAAIKRSLAQAAAGELEDADEFFAQLEQKYET
jgi:predicted transcriptional regulator